AGGGLLGRAAELLPVHLGLRGLLLRAEGFGRMVGAGDEPAVGAPARRAARRLGPDAPEQRSAEGEAVEEGELRARAGVEVEHAARELAVRRHLEAVARGTGDAAP